eukprot:CAMPEP_0185592822 /NCGR_PEP_ID=MMETSP0434-20130131/69339_1 /TAXON_ID=626734 ORGANISM="Favella taraikaensis, Strain Fe Narragansett Bay" /NCGR_SAMPLE_ID=MMETSP0434 /ASSEMBLY_ACC=CAM_ASM_000379 /LENGTH=59 /DNA_ID=CAMNT_0028218939 /DNA_START=1088 /DNA_END=1267 /DNA_ORIENTATION=-
MTHRKRQFRWVAMRDSSCVMSISVLLWAAITLLGAATQTRPPQSPSEIVIFRPQKLERA